MVSANRNKTGWVSKGPYTLEPWSTLLCAGVIVSQSPHSHFVLEAAVGIVGLKPTGVLIHRPKENEQAEAMLSL